MKAVKPVSAMAVAAAVSIMLLVAIEAPAQQAAQSSRELVLTVGKSLIINTAATIERVAVGFGEVAEARAVGRNEVLLDGKAPGETSLIIWETNGSKRFFDVTVRASTAALHAKIDALRRELREQLPAQEINASVENDTVFLSGHARDLTSVERATAIASTVGKVVNLLYVDVPPAEQQILLKVEFASVDRNLSNELGMNLLSSGATNTVGRVTTGQFSPPDVSPPSNGSPAKVSLSDALNFFLFRTDINLGATIRALQSRGLVEILAQPNVLAINGKPASFLAGGEFPYPILQGGGLGLGTITVAFREYGIRLNFLPYITARGTIRLDVAPEVSALDNSAGLTIQGFTIPGITSRKVQTEIELASGQSFAISGLLDRRLTETLNKIPLLADVPVLGKLFQSKSLQKNNTELLVIVTPEIVQPMKVGQPRPAVAMPYPLMGPDVAPRTPGVGVTGTSAAAPPPLPAEKLMESLRTEKQMKLTKQTDVAEPMTGAGGYGAGMSGAAATPPIGPSK